MEDLDLLVDAVRAALDAQPDSPVLEARVAGHADVLKSLEGDAARRSYVAGRVMSFASKRKVTRVLITSDGLRVDVPIVAPNEFVPPRGNERLIR